MISEDGYAVGATLVGRKMDQTPDFAAGRLTYKPVCDTNQLALRAFFQLATLEARREELP